MKPPVSLYEFMPYGAPELLEVRQVHLGRALLTTSVGFLILYAAVGQLLGRLQASSRERPHPVWEIRELAPPPMLRPVPPPVEVTPSIPKVPPAGIAVAVPDNSVPPDHTVASQQDLTSVAPAGPSEGVVVRPPAEEAPPPLGKYIYVEELPSPVVPVTPIYPDLAREAGVEGKVVVVVLVGKDGRVRDAVLDPAFQVPMLNDAALEAARKWVFRPALVNSQPVMVWTSIPFKFMLH